MDRVAVTPQEKELIIARLRSSKQPLGKLSVMTADGTKTFTVSELIVSIENDEEIGKIYVKEQMDFMKRLINGDVYKLINDIEGL